MKTEVIIISNIGASPKITIVVPAYNVEAYLEQCLNSLLYQTERNYKVIIVDDGSTDDTACICKKYISEAGDMFRYVYQENKGLGAARNKGLSLVETPYTAFLDSDDWQDIRFVEKFEAFVERLDFVPDMIFTLPRCYNEASHLLEDWMDKPLYDEIFMTGAGIEIKNLNASICPKLYLLEVNANRKIYRTAFLKENGFSFPEGVKWEDIRPHIQLVHLAKSCVALPGTGFIYRMNRAGQITAGTGKGRLDILKVFEDALDGIYNGYQVSSGGLPSAAFEGKELSAIMHLICNYTIWMIEMTNIEYIQALLEGLHEVFVHISEKMISAYSEDSEPLSGKAAAMDDSAETDRELLAERNKRIGLIRCLRGRDWSQLLCYEDRKNLYRYWSVNGGKRKNLISGGIQCIRDSGVKYTVKLLFRKDFYAAENFLAKRR